MRPTRPARRKFTAQEDIALKYYTDEMGTHNWQEIAKHMPNRTAKQCRDRYNNYLIDNHITGPWTQAEDYLILTKYLEIGAKWVEISKFVSGRSGNDVKNRWYKHLAKQESIQEKVRQNRVKEKGISTRVNPKNTDTAQEVRKMYSLANILVRDDHGLQ